MSDHVAGFSELRYPPLGFHFLKSWGDGHVFVHKNGLCVIIDAEVKSDGKRWCHVSYSRRSRMPDHADTVLVKRLFVGDRYAYAVFPPREHYVNLHSYCLHLWICCEGDGRILPEFSAELEEIGKSI